MKKIPKEELKKITAGATLSTTALKYIGDLFEMLIELGEKLGSSIRRIGNDKICPLDWKKISKILFLI